MHPGDLIPPFGPTPTPAHAPVLEPPGLPHLPAPFWGIWLAVAVLLARIAFRRTHR